MPVKTRKILFAVSGVMGLLASLQAPVLLPYPIFVLAVLQNWKLPLNGSLGFRLLISTLLCTLLLETSAWFDNFIRNNPEPALFHPQLIPDLIISIGVYTAWWLAWWMLLKRYQFTPLQIFLTTGVYGIVLEQQGAVFLAGLATMPLGIVLWLFVTIAYGSTMALAVFLIRDSVSAERDTRWKYPLALTGLFVITIITSLTWGTILLILNFAPPPKFPMQEHPLW